mgnify:CR=1 FL=1
MGAFETFLLLLAGHFVADYPLQGEFLAKAKNRKNPLPGTPWYQGLMAHSAIHGGIVGVVTGSMWLGLAEFVLHCVIDDAKCSGKISFDMDQALHFACKALWVALIAIGIS